MARYVADARIRSFRELREYWREDIAVNQGFWRPGAQALIMYRMGVWQRGLVKGIISSVVYRIYRFLHVVVRNYYGIEVPAAAQIGRRLHIVHQSAVVLHPHVVMGDDCLIRQGVTLGVTRGVTRSNHGVRKGIRRAPLLGDRVEIGAGAVIMGPITIGDDVKIGPNAVVMRNVPSGAVVAAPPARVMSRPLRPETHRTSATPSEVASVEEMSGDGND